MKNISTLMLCIALIGTQCSEDENIKRNYKTHDVAFKFNIDGVDQTVVATFRYSEEHQRPIEISGNVIEIEAIEETTGKLVYVYTYNSKSSNGNGREKWEIKTGYYGYYAGCFYWGTLIVGDNNQENFTAHSGSLNPPICPGGEWAYERPVHPGCTEDCE